MSKPIIKIAYTDIDKKMVESILCFVRDKYDFQLTTEKSAKYVFHSVGGYDILKYPGIRIFFTGENVTPNFAVSDYAMAFDKLSFRDRYIWTPLIKLYKNAYSALLSPRPCAEEILKQKTDFCAYVMSNTTDSADQRTEIFNLLCEYKKVNSGGRWKNNVGGPVRDKIAFQSKHKFVIAFENCSYPGYLTEKFAQAAQSYAIPIYWGDPEIENIINPDSFINCHNFENFQQVVQQVKKIDNDDELYKKMLSQPWFKDGVEPQCLRDRTFAEFLSNIFDQPPEKAYRRNRGRWGIKHEKNLYDMHFRPHVQFYKILRKNWRKLYHSIVPKRKKY